MGYNSNNNRETMFDNQLKPLYDGKVLVNESAMNDPVIQAVLRDMSNRTFNHYLDLMRVHGTYQIGTNHEQLRRPINSHR